MSEKVGFDGEVEHIRELGFTELADYVEFLDSSRLPTDVLRAEGITEPARQIPDMARLLKEFHDETEAGGDAFDSTIEQSTVLLAVLDAAKTEKSKA